MSNVLAFLLLFGILVFVHELGHFLAAKFFKVGVERFALGFGPKLFGKKVGETEYLIAALPLGGYVKMIGDEPTDEEKAEESKIPLTPNSFLAKPPWQRIIIALMGPIANLLLPIILFFILYMIGQPNLSTEVGYVSNDSPAQKIGIMPGDKITQIDGTQVKDWGKLTEMIAAKSSQPIDLTIQRGGSELKNKITPVLEDGVNVFGETTKVGRIGINPQSFLLSVVVPDEKSATYQAGFRSDDRIVAVNGVAVRFLWQLQQQIQLETAASGITSSAPTSNNPLKIDLVRQNKTLTVELNRNQLLDEKNQLALQQSGLYLKELVIEKILPNSIASEKGLATGDILYSLNGQPIHQWFSFQEKVRGNQGEAVTLTVMRQNKPVTFDLSPRVEEQKEELTGEKYKQRMLGVATRGDVSQENIFKERILNPLVSIPRSIGRCYEISKLTVIGFGKLISGKLSAKSLGGPIYIYQLAGKSWKSGIYDFIGMLVGISISLATLNLMPIPVLDGGHIMFYTIEMILGRPPCRTPTNR
jgi:regulator of sigma E protease